MGYHFLIQTFQSALPRGERLYLQVKRILHQYFNPRSHEGSDQMTDTETGEINISIRAPTRGATRPPAMALTKSLNFNPRSHEGSDYVR